MKCHCKFEFFKAAVNLLFDLFVFDSDDFEHLFEMEDEIFKVVIFLNDFVDREGDSSNSFSAHIERNLVLLRNEVRNLQKVAYFIGFIAEQFVLICIFNTFVKFSRYSR
jgi:hypothetical protein